jgi:hypothetical protein
MDSAEKSSWDLAHIREKMTTGMNNDTVASGKSASTIHVNNPPVQAKNAPIKNQKSVINNSSANCPLIRLCSYNL